MKTLGYRAQNHFNCIERRKHADKVLTAVAELLGTEVEILRVQSRLADRVLLRRQAIYLCHVHGKIDLSALGHVMERDRTCLYNALRDIKVTNELRSLGRKLNGMVG